MRAFRYSLQEAYVSLWRRRQSGLASTATIALALFVLGAFLLLTSNLERLGADWGRSAELSVYLADDMTPDQRQAIELAVGQDAAVTARDFVSKEEALRRFKRTFADLSGAIDSVGDNPLPASIEVRLKSDASASGAVEGLAARVRQMPGVADVRYDRQWLGRMLAAITVVRAGGFALAALLTAAAALTVANVVRLALYARRDEIEIMQLVGAPRAYIRGPFVLEGVLQGGLGALLAIFALAGVYLTFKSRYLPPMTALIDISSVQFLPLGVAAALVLGGMGVGCLGGLAAAWRT